MISNSQTLFFVASKHLLDRKRQSAVSLMGIILGVAFFLAISSLMQGSEKDFIKRLVDNAPHITISDEYRDPREQPANIIYTSGAIEIKNVKPITENRGIRGYGEIVNDIRLRRNIRASATLTGQALVNYAGKDFAITLNGMIPSEVSSVTTIQNSMIQGNVTDLIANPEGIIIGSELARKLSLSLFNNLNVIAASGTIRTFKILGIFRTGRSDYDNRQTFVDLKRAQAFFNRSNRVNSIIMKLDDAYSARVIAANIEKKFSYKSVSWQEASEDLMNTLKIRNIIMYTVVSAVLVVAAFGIYNVISTVVLEKQRDIAILKSIGFHAKDIQGIFLIQGAILGLIGSSVGIPLGCALMIGLMQLKFKTPMSTEAVQMPIDWGWYQFAIAAGFALTASILAAYLPARKAASLQPVDILRGS